MLNSGNAREFAGRQLDLFDADRRATLADPAGSEVGERARLVERQRLLLDSGVGIGPATIDAGGNARFNSLTLPNSAQPASVKPASETQGRNAIAGESKPGVNFGSVILFGNIPTNACKESEIPGVTAGTDTFLVPIWPALESGLTGMMYVVDSGKIRVRVCNVTTNAINVAAHHFGGRFIH